MVRPDVADFISFRKSCGDVILLATAAPGFYVRRVWPGEYFVATEYSDATMGEECRGEAKLKRSAVSSKSTACASAICLPTTSTMPRFMRFQCRGGRNQRACGA